MKVWIGSADGHENNWFILFTAKPNKFDAGIQRWFGRSFRNSLFICRAQARKVFKKLPRHGTRDLLCYELAARRVKGKVKP